MPQLSLSQAFTLSFCGDTINTCAPASSSAFLGLVNSDSSNPFSVKIATFLFSNSLMFLCFDFRYSLINSAARALFPLLHISTILTKFGTKPDQFLTELRKRMILKQRIALLSLIFGLWMPLMAQQASYQQDKTGLTLQFTDPQFSIRQQIRIQPITAHIIHVRSQPIGSDIKPTQNLIIVDSLRIQPGEWTVEEAGDDLLIKTSAITASVSRQTGAVSFLDHAGKPLVEEMRRDAGTFRSAAYDGDAFFAVQQGFRLSPNEAVYGLGQHQNGIMNYRGRQVTLLQYNTEVAVPFLISTNQYGILWNNYSITRAGDIRPLQPLSALRLYSADGQPGWLTAIYAMKDVPNQIILSRPEDR